MPPFYVRERSQPHAGAIWSHTSRQCFFSAECSVWKKTSFTQHQKPTSLKCALVISYGPVINFQFKPCWTERVRDNDESVDSLVFSASTAWISATGHMSHSKSKNVWFESRFLLHLSDESLLPIKTSLGRLSLYTHLSDPHTKWSCKETRQEK